METGKRKEAMVWWRTLPEGIKALLCDENKELLFGTRTPKSLTGYEIELLYNHAIDTHPSPVPSFVIRNKVDTTAVGREVHDIHLSDEDTTLTIMLSGGECIDIYYNIAENRIIVE